MFWFWFLYENLTLPKVKMVESTLTQLWLNLKQHIIGLNPNNHQVGFLKLSGKLSMYYAGGKHWKEDKLQKIGSSKYWNNIA